MKENKKDLERYRKEIDKLDEKIIELVAARTNWVYQIARYKAKNNLLISDEDREEKVYKRIKEIATENDISREFAVELFKLIIEHCKDLQVIKK